MIQRQFGSLAEAAGCLQCEIQNRGLGDIWSDVKGFVADPTAGYRTGGAGFGFSPGALAAGGITTSDGGDDGGGSWLSNIGNFLAGEAKTTAQQAASYGRQQLFGPSGSQSQQATTAPVGMQFPRIPGTGSYTPWIIGGAAVLGLILILRSRRR